jgi:hypothetical protein
MHTSNRSERQWLSGKSKFAQARGAVIVIIQAQRWKWVFSLFRTTNRHTRLPAAFWPANQFCLPSNLLAQLCHVETTTLLSVLHVHSKKNVRRIIKFSSKIADLESPFSFSPPPPPPPFPNTLNTSPPLTLFSNKRSQKCTYSLTLLQHILSKTCSMLQRFFSGSIFSKRAVQYNRKIRIHGALVFSSFYFPSGLRIDWSNFLTFWHFDPQTIRPCDISLWDISFKI